MITAPEGMNQLDVDVAELLVCAELGMTSLARRKVSEEGVLDGSVISARQGPIVTLTGVMLGESDMWDHVQVSTPWRVMLTFRHARTRYTLDYVTGWDKEEDVPAGIKQAVLLTASARAVNPHGVQSERLGDVSVTYGKTASSGLPETASVLLGSWRKPRW